MAKIKNKLYREFLDNSLIRTLSPKILEEALANVKGIYGHHVAEGRALLILLYYSGCRPVETFKMIAKDIDKDKSYITIFIPPAKHGRPRRLYFPYSNKHIREVYEYSEQVFPEQKLFYHYEGKYEKKYIDKSGKERIYNENTYKIRYYIDKWFKNLVDGETISPYFLRHNRFSSLAEHNATDQEIMIFKGARDKKSINYYIHMSKFNAKKVSRKVI